MNASVEDIYNGIIRKFDIKTINERDTAGIDFDNLSPEEIVVFYLLAGRIPIGNGSIRSIGLSGNIELYPNGLIDHFRNLPDEKQYIFVKSLAKEYENFQNAMKNAVPYREFR